MKIKKYTLYAKDIPKMIKIILNRGDQEFVTMGYTHTVILFNFPQYGTNFRVFCNCLRAVFLQITILQKFSRDLQIYDKKILLNIVNLFPRLTI